MADPEVNLVEFEIVRWTHLWAAAATYAYEVIDGADIAADPVTAIGKRNAMTLVLVDAVRNVYRGAARVLGPQHEAIIAFDHAHPSLVDVRNRLEHFDDYLRGKGRSQRFRDSLEVPSMNWVSSKGLGRGGHTVDLTVTVRGENGERNEVPFAVATLELVTAARQLVRALLEETGKLDEKHLAYCDMCANPTALTNNQ